jgi:YD repeat-containing protein
MNTWNRNFNLLVLLLVVCTSCKKDKDSPGGTMTDPCYRIVAVSYYSPYVPPTWRLTATVEYDDQGRIKKVIGEGQNAATYTYHKDRIELVATDIFGADISVIYFLDEKGRVTRTDDFDHKITYDAEGHLISYRMPIGTGGQITGYISYNLKYENGNLVQVTSPDSNVSYNQIDFTYYNEPNHDLLGYNQPLYIAGILGDRNTFFLTSAGFFGTQSKNLYKSVDMNDGYTHGTVQYTADAKGRKTGTAAFKFDYQCP